ncbi:WXG100-like domain-containing protein, partial [Nocardiopsis lambiniae]|nr:hypothetical protein [Nocardiopsis sp. DSM 44743]
MGMEIPDELANLFYGLTGTRWPKVDEDRLRDFSDAYAAVEYILATELPDLVLVLRRKVRSTFDSRTTEYFENSLAQFTAGERDYIGEAAELAGEIRQYAKDAANQVEYAKWMIIGQLIQLVLEIAWAIATAKFTFGASLKLIPLFKFIKSQIIRRILNWLVWNLLSHLFIAQMFGVTMDLLIQRIQMDQGNRDGWDKELTRMAAAGAFVEGLLGAGLSFGADLFLSGQLAKLFGKNLPDPPAPPPPPTRDILPDPPAGPPGREAGPDPLITPPPRDVSDTFTTPPRDTPDPTPPPRDPTGDGPTPPPRDPPGDGPDVPPVRVPPPPGSITPEFDRDLVNLFARNSNEFLGAAQRPNTASVGLDHARRFVDGSGDMFARHFGDTIGDAAARNLGRDYAETLLRTWNTPRMTSSLDDVLASAPLPQSTRDHLARDVPEAFGRTVADFGARWRDRATSLGIGAASGAFEGYVGEGLTNLWFSPEQEWSASGMSAVAGASTSVVHDLAVAGGLKGLDSLGHLRDLNDRPALDLDGPGPGRPDPGSRGSVSDDDASSVSSGWETPPPRGGNRGFESDDEPILRLRGGGGDDMSSFESYDGDGDDVSTIAPSDLSDLSDRSDDGDGGETSRDGEDSAARPRGDEDPGRRGPGAPHGESGTGGRGGERSSPQSDGTAASGEGGRERPGRPPAPAPEREGTDDTTGGDRTGGAGRTPPTTAVEPPPTVRDTGGDRSAQTPPDRERSEEEAAPPTSGAPAAQGHEGSHGNGSETPISPSSEDGSFHGEGRGTVADADAEGGLPRLSPDDGSGRLDPRSSEGPAEGIDIGAFLRSLNGDVGGTGSEGAPVPPPVVAAPTPPPSGAPASPSPSSGVPGASASGRPEGAGSGPSRDGVHGTAETDGSEATAHENVLAPADPPVVTGGPPVTETDGTPWDAEHTSGEVRASRTESTPVPPGAVPAAPSAEPPLSDGRGPEGSGSDSAAPPTGEERGPVPPVREEDGQEDAGSPLPDPENDRTGHEETPAAQGESTRGEGHGETPVTDLTEGTGVGKGDGEGFSVADREGEASAGEDDPVSLQREEPAAEGEETPDTGGAPPPSGESAETTVSDTSVVGAPPPAESSNRRSGSEAETSRAPKTGGGRDPLQGPPRREREPGLLPESGPEETPGTSGLTGEPGPPTPPVTESEAPVEDVSVGSEGGSVDPRGERGGRPDPFTEVKDPEAEESEVEESEAGGSEEKTPETREPKGKEVEVEESGVKAPKTERSPAEGPEAEESEAEESEAGGSEEKTPETREPKGKEVERPPAERPEPTAERTGTEDPGGETGGDSESGTSRAPKETEAPEPAPKAPALPEGPPGSVPPPPVGTSRAEGDPDALRLNYLIESRWIESYGVRVDPDAVLDTFPGLPDDVRALLGNGLTTDARDFFSPDGVSRTSSDGRTYTLRLSSENAWRSGGRDRPGAATAKYKGLHDEQTQTSRGESGLSGKARRPVVSVQANLFGVDAIPAPAVGGRVSAFGGSAVQQQSGDTNHTQLLTTEMTGAGETYNSDLTATWQVEGGPRPEGATPGTTGGTGRNGSGNPPPTTTTADGGGGTPRDASGDPPTATTATEGVDGIELATRRNPPPTTTTTDGGGGTPRDTSGNPPPTTTTADGGDGNRRNAPRTPPPARIPQGVELVLMGGVQHRDDLPARITFTDLWAPPVTPPSNGTGTDGTGTNTTGTDGTGTDNGTGTGTSGNNGAGSTTHGTGADTATATNTTGDTGTDDTRDTGTNSDDRRYGGYLANSHPIAIDSITRRAADESDGSGSEGSGTSRSEDEAPPTTLNSWIAERLGFEPPGTGADTRRVLHRTRGDADAPAVVSQPKTGSRARHRELNRRGVMEVFSDDIVMTQLPTMTSEPRTVSVPDADGGSRLVTLWSYPVSMELVPDTPKNFNIKMTDRLTRGSGQLSNRLKGFFVGLSAGIVSRLPGDMFRVEAPSFETRFQKVWTRGRGRSDNTWDSHLFHSTDTAVYKTRRTIAVWLDNDTTPTLFDVSATEALTADDVRRLAEGRPEAEPVARTGDPFLDREGGPTHLGDALVRDVTHADGTEIRTPDGEPMRPFFRDYAHRLLTEIDRQYPGLVLPHLALPGTPAPERSHAGWNHRRNKAQARQNTETLLAKVNAASFRSDPDAWLSGQLEIKLVETKVLPWLNEFRERRVTVHDHISVWPRVRITGYSEAAPLSKSHTGTTTGSSSGLNRQAGKITSVTAEGRFGFTARSVGTGLDSFGNPSEAGGVYVRASNEFRKRQRSEHAMSSTGETNVKDKSGSRRLFANAEFSAWFGPKDGLVPRSSRSEAVSGTGMGREIFGNGDGDVRPPRARVELHAPRVGRRVPLDTPPAGNPAPPRKLPAPTASRLFGQGPDGFVTTGPRTVRIHRSTPRGLETVTEVPEPRESAPPTGSGNPPRTTGGDPPPTSTGNPSRSTGGDPPGTTTATTPQPSTSRDTPRATTGNPPRTTTPGDTTGTTTGRQEGDRTRTTGNDTTGRTPRGNDATPPPLAIRRTPRAELLADTFGTVQAFNPAVFRRGEHVITVGSLTYAALDRDHWSFSRSVASRDGSAAIIAAHTSSQTLAASPGLTRSTGDRFRVQFDDGIAPQRTRPTTVTWYVPTHVVSAVLREFAVMEPNRVREISFGFGRSHETTFTISVAARGAFNPQPTAETPGQAPRGTVGPIVQPGLEARYTPYGHGQGESSSVSYRTRREVKFTGATFEFVTDGVILQATEHKKDFDLLFSVPRSTKESDHSAWFAPVKDAQKMMVPALWVFSQGLVHDRLTWLPDGTVVPGTQRPPQAPPGGLGVKPDLAGKGFDSRPVRVPALVDDLVRQLERDGWELTVHSREDLIKEVGEHIEGNRSNMDVLVKPTGTRLDPLEQGLRIKNRSRVAKLTLDIERGPARVEQLGGQMEYVDRNIKITGGSETNTRIRGRGFGGAVDLLAPIGNREDPATGRQTGAVNAGGTPAFRRQSFTEDSSSGGTAREETQERVLFSPYAKVTTSTRVNAHLSIGDRVYTATADDTGQESVHPLPYLETTAPTGGAPRPGPHYEPAAIDLDGSSYVDAWVVSRKGPQGTGFQDGEGGLDAIPVAIEGEAKVLLDAAVVNTALINGWTSPNGRLDLNAAEVASATRYLDDRISNIDRAEGITARKDEMLLLSLTPDATREPTVLAEFGKSVVKTRALLDTGSATIEGVSTDSRARDSDQEGGRQSHTTAEQKVGNLGVGGQATETGRPQDRVREAGEAESAALSGARGGTSGAQRHGAVASGPGTKRMFLVRVPARWLIWAESTNGTASPRGGQADSSVLRWIDADQARSWGLDTDSPAIERYAKAESAFTKADAAYFKARGELFSFVGQIDDPGAGGLSLQQRYRELEDAYHAAERVRNSTMRDLVDALRDLRGARTPAVPQTESEGDPPHGGESGSKAPEPTPHDDFFVSDGVGGSERSARGIGPPPFMTSPMGLTEEGHGGEGPTGGVLAPPVPTAETILDDTDLYDATPPGSPRPRPTHAPPTPLPPDPGHTETDPTDTAPTGETTGTEGPTGDEAPTPPDPEPVGTAPEESTSHEGPPAPRTDPRTTTEEGSPPPAPEPHATETAEEGGGTEERGTPGSHPPPPREPQVPRTP